MLYFKEYVIPVYGAILAIVSLQLREIKEFFDTGTLAASRTLLYNSVVKRFYSYIA